jgi:invasion protein IalB
MPLSASKEPARTKFRPILGAALLVLGASGAPAWATNANHSTKAAPAAAPAVTTAPAAEQSPVWSKQCVASPDGQKQACFVQQFVLAAPQNTVLLKVMFSYLGPQNKPRLILETPEGVLLQAGLVLTIDTRKPLNVPLQACQAGACRAVIDMDGQALDQFTKGNVLNVRYVTADHKAVDLPVKLETLTAALKQLTL